MYPVGGHGLSTCDALAANAEGYGVQKECQSWLPLVQDMASKFVEDKTLTISGHDYIIAMEIF